MSFSGQIISAAGLDQDTWIALIKQRSELDRPADRVGINPFTQERVTFRAPPTAAHIAIDGRIAGSVYWAMDDSPALIVEHATDEAQGIIDDIAAALGGRFVADRDGA